MRRIVVLEYDAYNAAPNPHYARTAYAQSVPRWNSDVMGPDQIPTQADVLNFALEASTQQSRLYAARVPSQAPPSGDQIVVNALMNASRGRRR